MPTVHEKFTRLHEALAQRHLERYDEISIALNALLCRYHAVLIGPPGTAKSMLAEDLVSAVSDTNLFRYLLTKFTAPEELFGPWDLSLLRQGEYERITTGKLPEAHIAFLDEFFKANSAIQNSLLTIMNERKFDNGIRRIDVPLMTIFAASNELPEGEELWALFDRFHYRKVVDYIQEPGNFIAMVKNQTTAELPRMSLSDLTTAQAEVETVHVPDNIYETIFEIRSDMQMEGIIASDRRFKQSIRALQASAWLDDRDVVDDNDFSILQHMLWSQPQEQKRVSRIVLTHTNPLELKAQEIIDMADEIAAALAAALLDARQKGDPAKQALAKQGIEWFVRCKQLGEEVKTLTRRAEREGRKVPRIEQARDRVLRVAKDVGNHTIGLDNLEMNA